MKVGRRSRRWERRWGWGDRQRCPHGGDPTRPTAFCHGSRTRASGITVGQREASQRGGNPVPDLPRCGAVVALLLSVGEGSADHSLTVQRGNDWRDAVDESRGDERVARVRKLKSQRSNKRTRPGRRGNELVDDAWVVCRGRGELLLPIDARRAVWAVQKLPDAGAAGHQSQKQRIVVGRTDETTSGRDFWPGTALGVACRIRKEVEDGEYDKRGDDVEMGSEVLDHDGWMNNVKRPSRGSVRRDGRAE